MHILDFIMWIIIGLIIWYVTDVISNRDYTNGFGTFVGCSILFIYTILYMVLFAVIDFNWIDIFNGIGNSFKDVNIKL